MFTFFSTLRHPSDSTPTSLHALPPLLQTAAQYNPNIFNGMKILIIKNIFPVFFPNK